VACGQLLHFDVNEDHLITVLFDATHSGNSHSSTVVDHLTVSYNEHPHVVSHSSFLDYCNALFNCH